MPTPSPPPSRRPFPSLAVHGGLVERDLSFDFTTAADAEDFRCAFYRFVELKSRAIVDPGDHCSIAIQQVGRRRVAEVGLWSPRAAAEFAGFWRRYAQVYGRRARSSG